MPERRSAIEWADAIRGAMEPSPGPTRGAVRTRGGEPLPAALEDVVRQLQQQPVSVRLEVVGELIRRGDDLALRALALLATDLSDPDPRVRWAIADGLWRLGASGAVPLLKTIARNDPDEMVRSSAIEALGARAMAAYETKVGAEEATPAALIRTRGAVRTRGASPVRQVTKEAQDILETLYKLRDEAPSAEVRRTADMTLRQLGE